MSYLCVFAPPVVVVEAGPLTNPNMEPMTSCGVCTCQLASVFLLLGPTETEKMAEGVIDNSTGVSVPVPVVDLSFDSSR